MPSISDGLIAMSAWNHSFKAVAVVRWHTNHLRDHDHGQRRRERFHEVDLVLPVNLVQQRAGNLGDARLELFDCTGRESFVHEAAQTVVLGWIGGEEVGRELFIAARIALRQLADVEQVIARREEIVHVLVMREDVSLGARERRTVAVHARLVAHFAQRLVGVLQELNVDRSVGIGHPRDRIVVAASVVAHCCALSLADACRADTRRSS